MSVKKKCRCTHCGQSYSVKEDYQGRKVHCKKCSQTFVVNFSSGTKDQPKSDFSMQEVPAAGVSKSQGKPKLQQNQQKPSSPLGQQRTSQPIAEDSTKKNSHLKSILATVGSIVFFILIIVFRIIARMPDREIGGGRVNVGPEEFRRQARKQFLGTDSGSEKKPSHRRNRSDARSAPHSSVPRNDSGFPTGKSDNLLSGESDLPKFQAFNKERKYEFQPGRMYRYDVERSITCKGHTYKTGGNLSLQWHPGEFLTKGKGLPALMKAEGDFGGILFSQFEAGTTHKHRSDSKRSAPFRETAGNYVLLDGNSHPVFYAREGQTFDKAFWEPIWHVSVDWIGKKGVPAKMRTFSLDANMPNWVPEREGDQFSVREKGFPRREEAGQVQADVSVDYFITGDTKDVIQFRKRILMTPKPGVEGTLGGSFTVLYEFDKNKKCLVKGSVSGTGAFENEGRHTAFNVRGSWKLKGLSDAQSIRDPSAHLAKLTGSRPKSSFNATLGFLGTDFENVDSFVFRPDGKLYLGFSNGMIGLYDPVQKKLISKYQNTKPKSIAFRHRLFLSRDGKKLIQLIGDRRMIVWNAYSKLLTNPQELEQSRLGEIKSMDVSKDGKYAVSLDSIGKLAVWNLEFGRRSKEKTSGAIVTRVAKVQFSKDEKFAVIANNDTFIQSQLSGGIGFSRKKRDTDHASLVLFSPTRKSIAKVFSEEIRIHSASRFNLLRRIKLDDDSVQQIAYSADGETLYCVYDDKIAVYRWRQGKKIGEIDLQGEKRVAGISSSPDGKRLVLLFGRGEEHTGCTIEIQ